MKKRKPPYALVTVLFVMIGVAVVMGGKMLELNSSADSHDLEEAIAAQEEEPSKPQQLVGVKPGELAKKAKEISKNPKQHLPDAPVVPLGSAIAKEEEVPLPKPNETSNRSLRGF